MKQTRKLKMQKLNQNLTENTNSRQKQIFNPSP